MCCCLTALYSLYKHDCLYSCNHLIAILQVHLLYGFSMKGGNTMKAVRIHAWGGNEVLQIEDIPVPEFGADEVLIRVRASSINPIDWMIRRGYLAQVLNTPMTLGWDVAGDVDAVGENVTHVAPGDAVIAVIPLRGGAFAEYAVVRSEEVVRKPATLDYLQAGAVPLTALTAYQLVRAAGVASGQTVLVQGGAGGVGSFAIQFAVALGAKVLATASANNFELLKSLGAQEVYDYHTQDVVSSAQMIDVVLDTVGGDTIMQSMSLVKSGGVVVTPTMTTVDESQYPGKHFKAIGAVPGRKDLDEIVNLIDARKVTPVIDRVLPLERIAEAFALNETRHASGKIVISIA